MAGTIWLRSLSGTRHIAIGYPSDLLNRTFNRHPEKTDRY
jgi:hypothetical protein